MDKLFQLKVFIAVAEQGGFNSAARKLNISPPVVTRSIAALEEEIGVKLFQRTTRHVRTTDAAVQYLADVKQIVQAITRADESVAGINSDPQGKLFVTAPVLFGRDFVMDSILQYLDTYPKVEVETLFLDRIVNFMEEGVDVGIRIGELPDSTMRARKVGAVRVVLCAAPEYLKRTGIPRTPNCLLKHQLISSRAGTGLFDWQFSEASDTNGEKGKPLKLHPRLIVSTNDAAIKAAKEGFGITRVLSYQIFNELASGQLKTIMEEYETPPKPINIIHREAPNSNTKVRAFVDLLAENLRKNTTLN